MKPLPPVIERTQPAGLIAVDGRTYPLKDVRLAARAHAGMAGSTLIQRFANPYEDTLEVCYSLALPADGAVIGYRVTLGDTKITGRIETREQAREEYRKALADGRLGGLMEQERPDTFTQWLGNVPGKTEVEVEVEVIHPLLFQAAGATAQDRVAPDEGAPDMRAPGLWEYRFPTVPGVRYVGREGRTPDAGRITVDRGAGPVPVRLNLDLEIGDGSPDLLGPRSTSHDIRPEPAGRGETLVRLTESARLDRDVVVEWRATRSEIGAIVAVGRGLPGDDGYYGLLSLTPPETEFEAVPRDLILLMDCSGSMHGAPLDAVRLIAREVLQSLGPQDTFELIAFADRPGRFASRPSAGTPDEIAHALRWVDRLEAGGCTEMADAVMEALRPLRSGAQRQVLLMTDGFIGFESEVEQCVARSLPESCRVHTVGVGSAPNRSLTQTVARCGRGVEVFAAGPEAAGEAAARLLASTVAPVLTDVAVTGSAIVKAAPRRAPDLYRGRPGHVVLELNPDGGVILVRGRLGRDGEWSRSVMVPAAAAAGKGAAAPDAEGGADADPRAVSGTGAHPGALPIGALFGREAIADLEGDLAAGVLHTADAGQQIEARGLRHRVTSRMTSLVAVSENRVTDPGKPRRLICPAQELPYGVSAEGVGLDLGADMVVAELSCEIEGYVCLSEERVHHDVDKRHQIASALRSMAPDSGPAGMAAESLRELLRRGGFTAASSRTEGDLLVLEFEVVEGVHRMPESADRVVVLIDGRTITAFVQSESAPAGGTLRAGDRIRLVLRTADGTPWRAGAGEVMWPESAVRVEFEPGKDT